jgi:hypothetical protein
MNRRDFLKAVGLGTAGLAISRVGWAAPPRPNVILFLVDDMGWMDCGAYGSQYYDTLRPLDGLFLLREQEGEQWW